MDADSAAHDIVLRDYGPQTDTFLDDVLHGLSKSSKTLPSKYLYDARGSSLFDAITRLDVYYPTRVEVDILQRRAAEIAAEIGERALIVEYGSGSSVKTRVLLDALTSPAGYVPIDISRDHLLAAAESIAEAYPDLEIMPVCADYTEDLSLPRPGRPAERVVTFFPGSTIGNFTPGRVRTFLNHVAATSDALLIGVDLVKDTAVLKAAYNDPEGVTAEFNLNLLRRINRELGADFNLGGFEHRAIYNADESRVEMHLVSRHSQRVHVGGRTYAFEKGESICTEYSYKYTIERFAAMAREAGLVLHQAWVDEARYFSIQLYHSR